MPCSYVLMAIVVSVAAPVIARTEEPAVKPVEIRSPMPQARLRLPAGFESRSAHLNSIRSRVEELSRKAESATDTLQRVGFQLAVANMILGEEIEWDVNHVFLKIQGENVAKWAPPTDALDRTSGLLEKAREGLAGATGDGNAERIADLNRRVSTITTFHGALRSFLLGRTDDSEREAGREAASKLSLLLEDGDPTIAAAAAFWQAVLRSDDRDKERILNSLDLALAPPTPASMPYAFFARLLRCRILADRGSHAAALSLLMQLEEGVVDWMEDEKDYKDATRTVMLFEWQTLSTWSSHLDTEGKQDEKRWCETRMESTVREHLAKDDEFVLGLHPVIPIVALPPDGSGPRRK